MKKIKRSEVPKDYRRNNKKEIVDFLMLLAICAAAVSIIGFVTVLH